VELSDLPNVCLSQCCLTLTSWHTNSPCSIRRTEPKYSVFISVFSKRQVL